MSMEVKNFFEKHGFYTDLDLSSLTKDFLQDMDNGLSGKKSFQDMIKTYIDPSSIAMREKSVIVIDAGGTNFRSSLVTFANDGSFTVSQFEKTRMPGTEGELSKKDFFAKIASNISRFKDCCDEICFCFSYAMTITEDKDGILDNFSKEVKAPEVVGSHIGAELKNALKEQGWTKIPQVILLNDTASALLAGTGSTSKKYSSYIGFILGTGLNAAFVQPAKAEYNTTKNQIIVCESAKFGGFKNSEFDINLDKKSVAPGVAPYEKLCSGAYLGPLALETIQIAAKEGLFSTELSEEIASKEALSLIEVNDFLSNGKALFSKATKEDSEVLFEIFDTLVDRMAKLAAVILAACITQCEGGKEESSPICVACNGTTFFKTYKVIERTKAYLAKILEGKKVYYDMLPEEVDITRGTAMAAFTN
ncbi:MAG: hexokinase [Treponema sp.]|nr:hexokinase [Treponema sp.]